MKKYTTVSGTVIIVDEENSRFKRIKKEDAPLNVFTLGTPLAEWIDFDSALLGGVGDVLYFPGLSPMDGYWYQSATITKIEEYSE